MRIQNETWLAFSLFLTVAVLAIYPVVTASKTKVANALGISSVENWMESPAPTRREDSCALIFNNLMMQNSDLFNLTCANGSFLSREGGTERQIQSNTKKY